MGRSPSTAPTRARIAALAEAVDAFRRSGFAQPLRAPGADVEDGAVAQLAKQLQRLSEQVVDQLGEQSQALARVTRQRRELLANVSHDLRTPLASMQGYLEMLLLRHDTLAPAELHGYLQTAVRQSERLARLVGDLFDLTRLEAEDMQPQPEPFALAELAQDIVQKFVAEAGRREVALHARCGGAGAMRAYADIGLVERLLDHLVDNALRHTPAGGTVSIEIERDECDQQLAKMAVRDTGHGIAAADLPGLFDRYERAARVRGAGAAGHAGLGLAIARRIADLHCSPLQVDSAIGRGTVVSFALPLDGAAPRRLADRAPPSNLAAANGPVHAEPGPIERLEQQGAALRAALERSEARRAQAEADLRAAEQGTLLALRGSQDGQWEWDLASGAVHLSPRWKIMLGFETHDLADDLGTWRSRVHPDDRAALEQALALHLDGGQDRFDHEMRLLHRDGSVRHVLSRGVAIRRDDGSAYRMVGVDTDVTRLRRVQAVLDAVADGTAGAFGADFFAAMVQQFARALQVDFAFISECIDDPPTRVRTLAFWSVAKGAVKNYEFDLAGTPCQEVLAQGRTYFYSRGLGERFPRKVGYEGYLGMPIVASDGRVLGHLAMFNREPLGEEVLVERVFRIFLARAAAEIERLQALARLAAVGPTDTDHRVTKT